MFYFIHHDLKFKFFDIDNNHDLKFKCDEKLTKKDR